MEELRLITDYSEKSFAVVAPYDCYYNEELTMIGGRYNSRLVCGGGWIFSTAKHFDAVKHLLAAYEIAYALTELTSEERAALAVRRMNSEHDKRKQQERQARANSKRGGSTGSKQTTSRTTSDKPDYILSDEERKEWARNMGDEKQYCKDFPVVCRLSGGALVPIQAKSIKTEFWHHDEGTDYEEHKRVTATSDNRREYFLSENLSDTQIILDCLNGTSELSRKYLWLEKSGNSYWFLDRTDNNPQATNAVEWLDTFERRLYERGEYCKLSDSDKERLIVAYGLAAHLQRKRCETWLKRYGVDKLSFRTYWADR